MSPGMKKKKWNKDFIFILISDPERLPLTTHEQQSQQKQQEFFTVELSFIYNLLHINSFLLLLHSL